MFTNCANNPIYIPNGGECDDCSQLESRVDNLEEAMTEVQEELPDKQDKLTAGEGIFITPDGIISTTSSMMRVNITGTDPYEADATFSEISTAYNNGNAVIANYNGKMLTLQSLTPTEAVFASTDDDSITFFTINNINEITSSISGFGLTHLVDGDAAGSVRGVNTTPEGYNYSLGQNAMAIGAGTRASGNMAFASGAGTNASGDYSHTEGAGTTASEPHSHAEGAGSQATGNSAHAEGQSSRATAVGAHSEGMNTNATENGAHAEGYNTIASGMYSHAEGQSTHATRPYTHAEGINTYATSEGAHAEGNTSQATATNSHAEGFTSRASAADAHSEGYSTEANGAHSHAEGNDSVAEATGSHAEGFSTEAYGTYSHAEGYESQTRGDAAHAEGYITVASGANSHSEGCFTTASGDNSHASGKHVNAKGNDQTVIGHYNIDDAEGEDGEYAFIVGNGTPSNPSNAFAVKWDGTVEVNGSELGGCCAEEVSGNPVILTDAKNMNAQSLEVDFEPIQDLNGYDYAWAGGNGKNKLEHNARSQTISGITFTVNSDGTVTADGTATAQCQLACSFPTGLDGDYKFCGCPAGGGAGIYDVYAWDRVTNARFKKWDGTTNSSSDMGEMQLQEIQIPSGHNGTINLRIYNGVVLDNIVFKPMIVDADVTDNTFEPYENICPISGAESVTVKRTGKNLIDTAQARITSGAAFGSLTVNTDGSLTVTKTGTGGAIWFGVTAEGFTFSEDVILTGCPSGGSGTTYSLQTGGGATLYDYGAGVTIPANTAVNINGVIRAGYTGTVTFYPMIRPASISDSTYEPYTAQAVSVNLGGEYYGGTIDLSTGQLEVTWKSFTFVGDDNTETWQTEGYAPGEEPDWPLFHAIRIPELDTSVAPYCESFGTMVGIPSETDLGFIGVRTFANYPTLFVRTPEDYGSMTRWLAYLQSNPLTVVAKLTTPTKVQLTSAQLELLEKYNVLTTDGATIYLSYMPDCYCGPTRLSQFINDLPYANGNSF